MGRLILSPGMGGPEAEHWLKMLARQYRLWLEHKGESCLVSEDGPLLYLDSPYLIEENVEAELGVHQLVRVGPDDPQGRRQTSFVLVSLEGLDASQELCRLYVLDPYHGVKNLRSGAMNERVLEVLDGRLEEAP